jgi:hypothetical protein
MDGDAIKRIDDTPANQTARDKYTRRRLRSCERRIQNLGDTAEELLRESTQALGSAEGSQFSLTLPKLDVEPGRYLEIDLG